MKIRGIGAALALLSALFLVFSVLFLSVVSGAGVASAQEQPQIVGFSGSKIKLYDGPKTKKVWKKFSAAELKDLGPGINIVQATNSRYAFDYDGKTVWIKRKNARTNGVKTGLPPCPKMANVAQEAMGNAVSRGSGKSCQ